MATSQQQPQSSGHVPGSKSVLSEDNSSSSRSHEKSRFPAQPLAAKPGINRPIGKPEALTEIDGTASHASLRRSRVPCKFYGLNTGCLAGDACRFSHDSRQDVLEQSFTRAASEETRRDRRDNGAQVHGTDPHRPQQPPRTNVGRIVAVRPDPSREKHDARNYQIRQLERRFAPSIVESETGTVLTFKLTPTDPDFPFELAALHCTLTVPKRYPGKEFPPSLQVTNTEIEKGFRINVERGFDSLVQQHFQRSLLALLNELDKSLEAFLTAQKAPTVKIIAPAKPHNDLAIPSPKPLARPGASATPAEKPTPQYSVKQKGEAQLRREADVRQLEARLRNVPGFSKSGDGLSFSIPITVPKLSRLPVPLRSVREVTLTVPTLFPLEPCTISLKAVYGQEAEAVEKAFEMNFMENPSSTLMSHLNHLTQNMYTMAKVEPTPSQDVQSDRVVELSLQDRAVQTPIARPSDDDRIIDPERPHVHIVSRPPEWGADSESSGDDSDASDTDFDDDNESDDDGDQGDGGAVLALGHVPEAPVGNSILLSFPDIELYGIELLEIASLSLVLKCDRCKTNIDTKNIKAKAGDMTTTVMESCTKCSSTLSATYTSDPIHANSIKAGHLNLINCTVADMLPTIFQPSCSSCSTPFPVPPGVVSVRGETCLSVCRSCHQKMTFKIPEAKFLRVFSTIVSNLPLRQKKKKPENLGITSGTPLPDFGRCSHYRKSRRWFRFSCCNRVFPCDKCHDEKVDPRHPNEHANRMICGYCSREQNYRPEDCGVCGQSLVGRKGGGFWEGGKGTRDKVRMNRKDPRKYKRRGDGASKQS